MEPRRVQNTQRKSTYCRQSLWNLYLAEHIVRLLLQNLVKKMGQCLQAGSGFGGKIRFFFHSSASLPFFCSLAGHDFSILNAYVLLLSGFKLSAPILGGLSSKHSKQRPCHCFFGFHITRHNNCLAYQTAKCEYLCICLGDTRMLRSSIMLICFWRSFWLAIVENYSYATCLQTRQLR